jgi:hypothetical protein
MSETHRGGSAGDGIRDENANPAALGAADWLCLAAAPAFAIMALLTAAGGSPDMICSASPGVSPLGGMVPMYLLMSAFHLAPWLRLLSSGRGGVLSSAQGDGRLDRR